MIFAVYFLYWHRSVQPDEVYNLAGQSSVGLSFEQPVETMASIAGGTLNLSEVIRFLNTSICFYSSANFSECFGDTGGEPADENKAFRPCSLYAVAKAAFWQVANYLRCLSFTASNGILFNHESPMCPERFVARKIVASACRIAQGSKEQLILGDIDIERDWGCKSFRCSGVALRDCLHNKSLTCFCY